MRVLLTLAALALAVPATAKAPAASVPASAPDAATLADRVAAILAAAPQGTRFGLLVVDEAGREVLAVAPDQRFIPASNTKLFTTAAAYALIPGIAAPDRDGGAGVALEGGNVVLYGRGGARLSSAADCKVDCLSALADAVAARTRKVRDVIGDDTWFPDQRWSPGMSWNNIGTDDGTAISALTLDDDTLTVAVLPTEPGRAPVLSVPAYLTVQSSAVTAAAQGADRIGVEQPVNSRIVRFYGGIPAGAKPWTGRLGVDDPALYAAWTLEQMLRARGVRVNGKARARHRPVVSAQPSDPALLTPASEPQWLARTEPASLADDVTEINKHSNNVHAEVLLRRLGRLTGDGSLADGLAAAQGVFAAAGIARTGYDFSDGSGMSTYNRISPRAAVALLRWAAGQPWGAAWKASLPVGGVDGSLVRRFAGTPLAGRIFAKTGTLNASNGLSGYMVDARGRTLTFAAFANDVPGGGGATATIDAALLAVAARP
ncbi:D-alanyl-D-alanine carboxypeptidase/D-alanyl-D-alanine endopeptidase [Parablastomonas sp. CN1-191]|uniref:D-alanyl-D-alanine carboxypeptidase/D-alanyl-D-alanine endopeptidase n=1 Tax=Parablastomonas sp. CN1-191 TaxID=3400908 RepID=UPI003BF85AE0